MKIITVLMLALSASVVRAEVSDVQVIIDGAAYSCSKGASSGVASCSDQASSLGAKYKACVAAYGSSNSQYCFDNTYAEKETYCEQAATQCNQNCINAYGSSNSQFCFDYCY